ncbi:MAG: hypothetical protein FJX72_14060 [Armatimonadetes bacterium]|nr:hypothetical protein [Armatimonadota bacterium]
MRTTIDLPDDLLRRAQASAARRGIKLKHLVTQCVERGLEMDAEPTRAYGHERPLPALVPPTDTPVRAMTSREVEDLLLGEEL